MHYPEPRMFCPDAWKCNNCEFELFSLFSPVSGSLEQKWIIQTVGEMKFAKFIDKADILDLHRAAISHLGHYHFCTKKIEQHLIHHMIHHRNMKSVQEFEKLVFGVIEWIEKGLHGYSGMIVMSMLNGAAEVFIDLECPENALRCYEYSYPWVLLLGQEDLASAIEFNKQKCHQMLTAGP